MTGPPWIEGDDVTDRPGYDTDHHEPRPWAERDNAGLREAITRLIDEVRDEDDVLTPDITDALLSGPLAALLAERGRAVEGLELATSSIIALRRRLDEEIERGDKAVAQVAAVRVAMTEAVAEGHSATELLYDLHRVLGGTS